MVAFNVVYNNGGQGIKATASDYVTFANNTCFNSSLDPYQNAAERSCLTTDGGNDVFPNTNLLMNNIAYSLPPSGACIGGSYPEFYGPQNGEAVTIGGDSSGDAVYNSPGHNITDQVNGNCTPEDWVQTPAWSCTANKCTTDPLWVAVSGTGGTADSTGSETTRASQHQFRPAARQPGHRLRRDGALATVLVGRCRGMLQRVDHVPVAPGAGISTSPAKSAVRPKHAPPLMD